jgi:hypothetical protein
VNVFIVGDDTARIDDSNPYADIYARSICVFANRIEFQGPPVVGGVHRNMNLYFRESMRSLANSLVGSGVLPGYSGQASGRFVLEAGSWTTSPGLQ